MIFMQFKPDSTLVSYFYSCPTRHILYKHLSELKKCVPFNRRRITSCMHACQYETCLSVCICGGTHSTERRREGLLLKTLLGQCCPSGLSLTLILCSDSHSRCSFTRNYPHTNTHTHTHRENGVLDLKLLFKWESSRRLHHALLSLNISFICI